MSATKTSAPFRGTPFADRRETIASRLATLKPLGPATTDQIPPLLAAVEKTFDRLGTNNRLDAVGEADALRKIAETLSDRLQKWQDVGAAHVLFSVGTRLQEKPPSLSYIAENIGTWLETHVDHPANFAFCIQVSPPAGIAIESVLNAGAQKQVFVARWPEVTPHKVAFKCFHDANGVGSGDAFSHPLRGHHPNIIETFPLENAGGDDEVYLVERLLPTTLSYGWDFHGLGEIVNLLRDIAHALSFVHSFGRLHGDVKLENIGFEELYILLDFGLCRSEPAEVCAWTPTGNVRAMAPELLHGDANTRASDVWALGSVTYAALTGQPPFLTPTEKQHGFAEGERERKLESLAKRADDPRWRKDLERRLASAVPELRLRRLLTEMLDPDPSRRPPAQEVFERCNRNFPQFLRPVETIVQATAKRELSALRYLHDSGGFSLASHAQLIGYGDAARHIDKAQLTPVEKLELEKLQAALRPH